MFEVGTDWNPLQTRLKEIILKADKFDEMQALLLKMHSLVHSHEVYKSTEMSYMDEVWIDLDETAFRVMPTDKDDTVAWDLWHITRIEDLTANFLIAEREQILNEAWLKRLNVKVTDTGNAMTDPEIIDFSSNISKEALYEYRNTVGLRTKEIIESLKPGDLRRKVPKEGLKNIERSGGVTQNPTSNWLLDFWGRKNIAGIIQMPITRHQIVHLNDCRRLKKVYARGIAKKK